MLARFHYADLSTLPLVDRAGKKIIPQLQKDFYMRQMKVFIQATAHNLTNLDSPTR